MRITEANEFRDDTIPSRYSGLLHRAIAHTNSSSAPSLHNSSCASSFANASTPPGLARNGSRSRRRATDVVHGAALFGATLLRSHYKYEEQCSGLVSALQAVLSRNERVVDVGCGSGYLLTELRELGYEVAGLDTDDFVSSMLASSVDIRPLLLHDEPKANANETRGQVVHFLHAHREEAHTALVDDTQSLYNAQLAHSVCSRVSSRAVLGWGRRCLDLDDAAAPNGVSPGLWCQSDYSREALAHNEQNKQEDASGGGRAMDRRSKVFQQQGRQTLQHASGDIVDADGPLDPAISVVRDLLACGLRYAPELSVQVWEPLRRERQRVRNTQGHRQRMVESDLKRSHPSMSWCDGTSTVMVFERLSLPILERSADAFPPCSTPLLESAPAAAQAGASRGGGGDNGVRVGGLCVEVLSPPDGAVVVVRRRRKRKGAAVQVVLLGFRASCEGRCGSGRCPGCSAGSGGSARAAAAGNAGNGGVPADGLRPTYSSSGDKKHGGLRGEKAANNVEKDDTETGVEAMGEGGQEEGEEEEEEEAIVVEQEAVLESETAGEILCVMYKVCVPEFVRSTTLLCLYSNRIACVQVCVCVCASV